MKLGKKMLVLLLAAALVLSMQSVSLAETAGPILNVQFDVEVASMDPQVATDGTSFEAQAAITEGLYILDAAGSPSPLSRNPPKRARMA